MNISVVWGCIINVLVSGHSSEGCFRPFHSDGALSCCLVHNIDHFPRLRVVSVGFKLHGFNEICRPATKREREELVCVCPTELFDTSVVSPDSLVESKFECLTKYCCDLGRDCYTIDRVGCVCCFMGRHAASRTKRIRSGAMEQWHLLELVRLSLTPIFPAD